MLMIKVKLVGVLKALALGRDYIEINDANTVREAIFKLREVNEKLFRRIYDPSRGELMPDIYVAVNDIDIRLIKGLDTSVKDGDEVLILAYIHGG